MQTQGDLLRLPATPGAGRSERRNDQFAVFLEVSAQVEASQQLGSDQGTPAHRHDRDFNLTLSPEDHRIADRNGNVTVIGQIDSDVTAHR
jgi:hypothetical protein